MADFHQLIKQSYLNIETFRKSGLGVKTPVWFVQEGDTVFVRTDANSGKVKRVHNNGQVNIAPCKMDGALLGDWLPATACEINDPAADQKVDHLLGQKYGLMKMIIGLAAIFRPRKSTILEVKLR